MLGRALIGAALVVALAAPAQAQFEVTFNGGYTASEGITGDGIVAGDGNIYNSIDVSSGGAFNVTFAYIARNGGEFGFLWGRQMSELGVSGTNSVTIGDMSIDNYHGYFGYNFGEFDAKVRPYLMIGFGATDYGSVDYDTPLRTGTVNGPVRFSTTWGAGVKFYASPNVGFKAGVRWTPTYITSDAEGWWCDPWWGCYVVGDSKYAHQFEISGGIAFKFGG